MKAMMLLLVPLLGSGCAEVMMASGAGVAAHGLGAATATASQGAGVNPGAVAAVGVGAALMYKGYQMTPPDKRGPTPRKSLWVTPSSSPNAPARHYGMPP
jgi:hypothetical protein